MHVFHVHHVCVARIGITACAAVLKEYRKYLRLTSLDGDVNLRTIYFHVIVASAVKGEIAIHVVAVVLQFQQQFHILSACSFLFIGQHLSSDILDGMRNDGQLAILDIYLHILLAVTFAEVPVSSLVIGLTDGSQLVEAVTKAKVANVQYLGGISLIAHVEVGCRCICKFGEGFTIFVEQSPAELSLENPIVPIEQSSAYAGCSFLDDVVSRHQLDGGAFLCFRLDANDGLQTTGKAARRNIVAHATPTTKISHKRVQHVHVEIAHTVVAPSPEYVVETVTGTVSVSNIGMTTQVGMLTEEIDRTTSRQFVVKNLIPVFCAVGTTHDGLHILVVAQVVDHGRKETTFCGTRTACTELGIEQIGHMKHVLRHFTETGIARIRLIEFCIVVLIIVRVITTVGMARQSLRILVVSHDHCHRHCHTTRRTVSRTGRAIHAILVPLKLYKR